MNEIKKEVKAYEIFLEVDEEETEEELTAYLPQI